MKTNDIQQLIAAAQVDKEVRAELLAAGELDKPTYHPHMRAVHEANAALLETFLDMHGWPFPAQYGVEAHEAAWFIAIHAISRPDFIKKVAAILKAAWQEGKIPGKYYANFYDRIELYEGRQQLYGTHLFPSKTGWQVWNLKDLEHVDTRRKALGMSTLQEWIAEAGDESGFSDEDQEAYEKGFDLWCRETGWRK